MLITVMWLYIIGYLLVIASVVVAVPITNHALQRMAAGGEGLWSFELDRQKELSRAVEWAELNEDDQVRERERINRAALEATYAEAARLGVTYTKGLAFGAEDSQTIINAVKQVGRANKPTALVALTGGLCSTIASVMSLFL